MRPWAIELLSSPEEINGVLAVEEASFSNPWSREMYLAELENSGISFCFLAKDEDGRVVGFCSFWRVLDELHINNLAVAPANRRAGAGSALLSHALQKGATLGAERATLEVRRSNQDARALYERFGFTQPDRTYLERPGTGPTPEHSVTRPAPEPGPEPGPGPEPPGTTPATR